MEKIALAILLVIPLTLFNFTLSYAQSTSDSVVVKDLSSLISSSDSITEKDIGDVFWIARHKDKLILYKKKKQHEEFTLVPAVGYTLQTGFTILLAANSVFYTNKSDRSKSSTFMSSIAYTQYNQIILPIRANIWSKDSKYDFISDVRYMSYPSQTYGLGAQTTVNDGYNIDFSYFKFHQSLLRRVKSNFFSGAGFYYDQLWNVREINPPAGDITSFEQYGLNKSERASGFSIQNLIDTRPNQVNPTRGLYATLRYRLNHKGLGSTSNWQSGILEFRKYYRFSERSKNMIAFWNYNWFTFGTPPYLLLPSTGWDDFFNVGRGYIQGRFLDKNMSYMEVEYRFRLVENGVLGAVVFTNAQTFSNSISSLYGSLIPGYGAGLRIKLNKNSATNLCIDYAFGKEGSRGFFINLGEVF